MGYHDNEATTKKAVADAQRFINDRERYRHALSILGVSDEIIEQVRRADFTGVVAHARYAGSGWHTGPDSWPRIGEKYIVKIRGHLQEDVYEFDQGDDGIGGGEYFWSRDDVDDCPAFDPNKDEWLLLSDADTNPPAQENTQ